MQGIFLAAGNGLRLKPITNYIPKPLINIGGKTILEHILESFSKCALSESIIIINDDFLKTNTYSKLKDTEIKFIEQKEILGTAHALKSARNLIHSEYFLVHLADTLIIDDIEELITKMSTDNSDLTILSSEVEKKDIDKIGSIEYNDKKVIQINEKLKNSSSNLAWAGTAIFKTNVFFDAVDKLELSSRGEYEIPQIINHIIKNNFIVNYIQCKKFIDIGTITGLKSGLEFLLNSNFTESNDSNTFKINKPVFIEKNSIIGNNCSLGPFVSISENSSIGDNSKLKNCIIINGKIPKNSTITNSLIFEEKIFEFSKFDS